MLIFYVAFFLMKRLATGFTDFFERLGGCSAEYFQLSATGWWYKLNPVICQDLKALIMNSGG